MYDGDAILLEYDGGNALQARYSHGEEIDQPLAMTRGGESYFYGVDHLGSVRLVTDAAGAVANRYDYDAFGNLEATSYETVANPYAFTARERDTESGLMFYRARYYDPKIGRFISEDPIGFEAGDLNIYRYVFNGPIIFVDPSGEITLIQYVEIGLAVAAAITVDLVLQSYYLTADGFNFCGVGVTGAVTFGAAVLGTVLAGPIGVAAAAVVAVSQYIKFSALGYGLCKKYGPQPTPTIPYPDGDDPTWGDPYPAPTDTPPPGNVG